MKCFPILSPSLVQTEIILDVVNISFYGGSDFVHFLDHLICISLKLSDNAVSILGIIFRPVALQTPRRSMSWYHFDVCSAYFI